MHSTGRSYSPSTVARARFGLIANQENECHSPDSFVGFGASYEHSGISISAGNFGFAATSADNDNLNVKAVGYIMVR